MGGEGFGVGWEGWWVGGEGSFFMEIANRIFLHLVPFL